MIPPPPHPTPTPERAKRANTTITIEYLFCINSNDCAKISFVRARLDVVLEHLRNIALLVSGLGWLTYRGIALCKCLNNSM